MQNTQYTRRNGHTGSRRLAGNDELFESMQNVEKASCSDRKNSNAKIGELANKSANTRNLEAVAASEGPSST